VVRSALILSGLSAILAGCRQGPSGFVHSFLACDFCSTPAPRLQVMGNELVRISRVAGIAQAGTIPVQNLRFIRQICPQRLQETLRPSRSPHSSTRRPRTRQSAPMYEGRPTPWRWHRNIFRALCIGRVAQDWANGGQRRHERSVCEWCDTSTGCRRTRHSVSIRE
jgi:hypothetical protein